MIPHAQETTETPVTPQEKLIAKWREEAKTGREVLEVPIMRSREQLASIKALAKARETCADELERVLSGVRGPQEWQPIATAPKDRTRIIVFVLGEERIAYHDGYNWLTIPGLYTLQKSHPPTHWMPLPTPPGSRLTDAPQHEETKR